MLEPAINNKYELQDLFEESMYSEDSFWCSGNTGSHMPSFENEPNVFKYAVMDIICGEKICIGYFSFDVDYATKSVSNIMMIAFLKGRISFLKDVHNKLLELMRDFDRIEFSVICGNPVEKHYDRFIKKHKGQKFVLHNCVMDNHGKLYDNAIYEILTKPSSDTDLHERECQ